MQIRTLALAALLLAASESAAQDQRRSFYDRNGSFAGSSTTDRHFYASVPFLAQFERRLLRVGAMTAVTCPRHRACTRARTNSSAVHRDLKDQAGYPHAGHSTAGLLMSAREGPDIRPAPLQVESSSAPNHPGRRRPCAATSGCDGERVSAVLDRVSVQRGAKRMILCVCVGVSAAAQ
jgi:hypothetical protein